MTKLCQLARKYETDKSIKHDYTPYYFELFNPIRDKVKKVLEIGVGFNLETPRKLSAGGSLRMWRDFFPNAQIYGVENRLLHIEQAINIGDNDRITFFQGNAHNSQSIKDIIEKVGGDIDIVIDDGAHVPRGCRRTVNILMPLLKKDVIYIIEDGWGLDEYKKMVYNYDIIDFAELVKSTRKDNHLIRVWNE